MILAFLSGLGLATLQSWHCLTMCGFLSSQVEEKNPASFYLGRAISYGILGAIAGTFSIWIQSLPFQFIQVLFLVIILAMCSYILAKDFFPNWPRFFLIPKISFMPKNPFKNYDFAKGLMWGFMPCHFLWLQILIAASFPYRILSILYMLSFAILTTISLSTVPLIKSYFLLSQHQQKHRLSRYFEFYNSRRWLKILKVPIFLIFVIASIWSTLDHSKKIGTELHIQKNNSILDIICQ
jgi:sulfite exporter TauE/SafE